MPVAVLFLPVKIESECLTAKGPKPSGTFQRKPPRVYSKFITLWNSSTWTALFPLLSSPSRSSSELPCQVPMIPCHVMLLLPKPHHTCALLSLLSVSDSQGTHINPVSPVWNLQDLAFPEDSLIKSPSDLISQAVHLT